ncbi:MAG: hypothetical protein WBF94_10315 [Gordonia sp. (in: high G+C Gram-positive bacteria)]
MQLRGLLAGADADGIALVDLDDTIGQVHGYAKQAAAFGYTGVRGLNLQLATISTPIAAPVIARARLRKGNTASATGAGRLLAQTLSTARAAAWPGRSCAARIRPTTGGRWSGLRSGTMRGSRSPRG